ncbi:MAG: hypothetical protein F6K11_31635 [Leptolyngbya sp. SIO3F4]|nr:hypothetical protein [Leptolyngbya sp. SIO3F4]
MAAIACAAAGATLTGCQLWALAGGAAQNFEYQKKIEVLAEYQGLQDKKVAILIDMDPALSYEFAGLDFTIADMCARRIAENVPGALVVNPRYVIDWQYRTPQWNAMGYGDIAEMMGVDRIVHVDLYEYRLNPPGNRFEWEGVIGAYVNVLEADGFDPDIYAATFDVSATFPDETGVPIDAVDGEDVATVLVNRFARDTAWLFYDHVEPKYPDKYRPELDNQS